jgi:hypothetical protein
MVHVLALLPQGHYLPEQIENQFAAGNKFKSDGDKIFGS